MNPIPLISLVRLIPVQTLALGDLHQLIFTPFTKCQQAGFDVQTFPKYPDFRTGVPKEKGIDHKICWEIAKTIFTNKDSALNKKIILCTGDKDFMTIMPDIQTSNWEFEVWLWTNSASPKFTNQVKVFGTVKILDGEWKKFMEIGVLRNTVINGHFVG